MECAEHGICRGRQDVGAAEVRVVDVEVGRVGRTADFGFVRRRAVPNVVPIDAGEPGMILNKGQRESGRQQRRRYDAVLPIDFLSSSAM